MHLHDRLPSAGTVRTPQGIIDGWASEAADYAYATNSCADGKVCGHYTQVVWRDSLRLGCGMVRCDGAGVPLGVSQIWVCNCDPPGNVDGLRPY